MKRIIFLPTLFIFFMITNCQKKINKIEMKEKVFEITGNEKLIDGIKIEQSGFKREDVDLKKFQFKGQFLENLLIKDLLNQEYRDEFIKYLKIVNNEDDEFKATLISQLLFIRISQLKDGNSFFLLSEFSKDTIISYNGIELFPDKLTRFFIENPLYIIQQGTKYHENNIINFITSQLDEFLVQESFFKENLGTINLQGGELFLLPEKEDEFSNQFRELISNFNKEDCIFSPSLYTEWQNKTIIFTDISSIFGFNLLDKCNIFEKNYFNQNIFPALKRYIISGDNKFSSGIIIDPDGYTNLREEKSATSEILQKINSGENIQVLDNSGDWLLVKTKEGKEGYVHKSRIKSN